MTESPVIAIRSRTEDRRRLWTVVLSLAGDFGPDREWSLIGGLMVQLYAYEREDPGRPPTST